MVLERDIIKFKVSESQWSLGYSIGMARFAAKNGYASTRNLSKINTHVCGAVAEIIFGEWQDFQVDKNIDKFVGDKQDFLSRMDETVDVKQSTFAGSDIELKEKVENVLAGKIKDIYVLCRAIVVADKVSEVHVIGWIPRNEYLLDHHKREPYKPNDTRYPWNYVVGLDKLHPFIDKKFGKELVDEIALLG